MMLLSRTRRKVGSMTTSSLTVTTSIPTQFGYCRREHNEILVFCRRLSSESERGGGGNNESARSVRNYLEMWVGRSSSSSSSATSRKPFENVHGNKDDSGDVIRGQQQQRRGSIDNPSSSSSSSTTFSKTAAAASRRGHDKPLVLTGSSYLMPTLRLERDDTPESLEARIALALGLEENEVDNDNKASSTPVTTTRGKNPRTFPIRSMLRGNTIEHYTENDAGDSTTTDIPPDEKNQHKKRQRRWKAPIVLDLGAFVPDGSPHYISPRKGLLLGFVRALDKFDIKVVGVTNPPAFTVKHNNVPFSSTSPSPSSSPLTKTTTTSRLEDDNQEQGSSSRRGPQYINNMELEAVQLGLPSIMRRGGTMMGRGGHNNFEVANAVRIEDVIRLILTRNEHNNIDYDDDVNNNDEKELEFEGFTLGSRNVSSLENVEWTAAETIMLDQESVSSHRNDDLSDQTTHVATKNSNKKPMSVSVNKDNSVETRQQQQQHRHSGNVDEPHPLLDGEPSIANEHDADGTSQQHPPPSSPPLPSPPPSATVYHGSIRTGQQISSDRNQSLIVIGSVHSGGEVLSDGDIFIFGKLRGRALAGLSTSSSSSSSSSSPSEENQMETTSQIESDNDGGSSFPSFGIKAESTPKTTTTTITNSARIFASNFDPELVCIGDTFTTVDNVVDLGLHQPGEAAMVSLDQNGELQFERIPL